MAPELPMKIEVYFEARPDGGLRARCPGVPAFALSHSDPRIVEQNIEPVLGVILSEMLGREVMVRRMVDLSEALGSGSELPPAHLCSKEYVGTDAR